MYKLSAAAALAAVLTVPAFAQAPASANADQIKVEGAQPSGTSDDFEASVLVGFDRRVAAQKTTLAALRAQHNEDYPDLQTAKLNLAILQAQRDALARTNADRANIRVAALLDPGRFTRGATNSPERAAEPAAHESLFDFSKSQTITGAITALTFVSPYSIVTVDVSGALTNVFLASTNALAAAGWTQGAVKRGDQITITGAPARSGANILQATEVSSQGKSIFSRPAVELSRGAVAAYEK